MKGKKICKLAAIMMFASLFPLGVNTVFADEADTGSNTEGTEVKEKNLKDYQKDLEVAEKEKAKVNEEINKVDEEIISKTNQLDPDQGRREINEKLSGLKREKYEVEADKESLEKDIEDLKKQDSEKPDVSKLFPSEEEYKNQEEKAKIRRAEIDAAWKYKNEKSDELKKNKKEIFILNYEKERREENLVNLNAEEKEAEDLKLSYLNLDIKNHDKEIKKLESDLKIDREAFKNAESPKLDKMNYELEIKKEYEEGKVNLDNIDIKIAENETKAKPAKNDYIIDHQKYEELSKQIGDKRSEQAKVLKQIEEKSSIASWIIKIQRDTNDLYYQKNKDKLRRENEEIQVETKALVSRKFELEDELAKLGTEISKAIDENNTSSRYFIEYRIKADKYKELKAFLENPLGSTDKLIKEKEKLLAEKNAQLNRMNEEIARFKEAQSNIKDLTEEEKQKLQKEIDEAKDKKLSYLNKREELEKEIEKIQEIIKVLMVKEDKTPEYYDNNYLGYYNFMTSEKDDEVEIQEKDKEKMVISISRLRIAYNRSVEVFKRAQDFVNNKQMSKERRQRLQSLLEKQVYLLSKTRLIIERLEEIYSY
ncbi:hypothetical protein [Anaerococcus sp. Marseille-P3915]|uniref:hypothetical protein n=1 Tax=Anaerococcus sp. Marseille-P3915 TaxID=2057799 RepID=UPI000D0B0029|nr:hypothetical protein [Anaerococcus sp. Marseille-P3915]